MAETHDGVTAGNSSDETLAPVEPFTDEERRALAPFVTNLDSPVFVLTNLPDVVKGALFARYSRSNKSLRRLLLDEFLEPGAGPGPGAGPSAAGRRQGEALYERVFVEFGDDSVAQLGAVHLACEGASNILTKVLERPRLAAYLEQSTRYIPYTDRPAGRFRYHVPEEVAARQDLAPRFCQAMDLAFETYCAWLPRMIRHFEERHPAAEDAPRRAYRAAIRAKALDSLRGLLPAATRSNVGIFADGQALEALLLRMRVDDRSEVRRYAALMLAELRKVIPAFMRRVDLPDRGQLWSGYLQRTRRQTEAVAAELAGGDPGPGEPGVRLSDFDPQGERKVIAAILYPVSRLSDAELASRVDRMTESQRAQVLRAYVGRRENRRHRPGRALERTSYRFDILADYGAFRDLQRHRMLTLDWQPLCPHHGYAVPEAVQDAGGAEDYGRVMEASARTYRELTDAGLPQAAPYAVSMAYRVRFYMEMNAREAMHVLELRSAPQGHLSYRLIAQAMHRLIRDQAGHRGLAEAMCFVDHGQVELERLETERHSDERR